MASYLQQHDCELFHFNLGKTWSQNTCNQVQHFVLSALWYWLKNLTWDCLLIYQVRDEHIPFFLVSSLRGRFFLLTVVSRWTLCCWDELVPAVPSADRCCACLLMAGPKSEPRQSGPCRRNTSLPRSKLGSVLNLFRKFRFSPHLRGL